jgi:hypothetical protein
VGALGAFLEEGGESDYLALLAEHCQRSRELADCVKSSLITVMCVGGGRRDLSLKCATKYGLAPKMELSNWSNTVT